MKSQLAEGIKAHRCKYVAIAMLIAWSGCSLTGDGARQERARLNFKSVMFESPETKLPELSSSPTWKDVLSRAFLANGELKSAYFEWKAAIERIDIAAAYPNSNIALSYSAMFGPGQMKSFDRMTFGAQFDPMENLAFPLKVIQAGKIALDEARATGERFRATKFDLQRRVLTAWTEYLLLTENQRIEQQRLLLLKTAFESAQVRTLAGEAQPNLLRTDISISTTQNQLQALDAGIAAKRANLNGLLNRDPNSELRPPVTLPLGRQIIADDYTLIAAGVDENPELSALAQQVQGRKDALALARLQWIPDINPSIAFTGGISQAIGAAIILPTTIKEINGKIKEARANLQAGEAMLHQTKSERAALFVATLISIRDSERQQLFFQDEILPKTNQLVEATRQLYIANQARFSDLIEAQITFLDVQLAAAEFWATRETRLAELEALAGIDFETISSTSPSEINQHKE